MLQQWKRENKALLVSDVCRHLKGDVCCCESLRAGTSEDPSDCTAQYKHHKDGLMTKCSLAVAVFPESLFLQNGAFQMPPEG